MAERKQRQIAETLRSSSQEFAQTLDLDLVLKALLKYVRSLVQADTANVIFREGDTIFRVCAAEGFERWIDPNLLLTLKVDGETNPFLQKLVTTRRSFLISNPITELEGRKYPGLEYTRTFLFLPIVAEDEIIGVVGLGKIEPGSFAEEHVQWAETLVGQAAVAIQNAWLFEQLRAGRERIQTLLRRLVEIQETERRFIARELHDHAGQTLTSLILGLGMLEKEADSPQNVRTRAAELKGMTDGVLEDLHRLAVNLRPTSLDHLGLVPALEQLVKSSMKDAALQIKFKAIGIHEDDRFSQEVEATLYRIAQEALTNVTRHANASNVDIVLERLETKALILVEDDGTGFDVELAKKSEHLGLLGMQERAEMLGGTFTVESIPGKGTTLVAEVPYVHTNHARG